MPTSLIQPRKRGVDSDKLTATQLIFCNELIANDFMSPTEAAKKAGYKCPNSAANKLMKAPDVRAYLGKALQDRIDRLQYTADEILEYLFQVLDFNPLTIFQKTESGHWLVKDLDDIPHEVGRLIESVEMTTRTRKGDIEEGKFKVKFVSKTTAAALTLKHMLFQVEQTEAASSGVDWDALHEPGEPIETRIEEIILEAESKPVRNSNGERK